MTYVKVYFNGKERVREVVTVKTLHDNDVKESNSKEDNTSNK